MNQRVYRFPAHVWLILAGTQITLLATSEHLVQPIYFAKVGSMSPGMKEYPQHPAHLGTDDKRGSQSPIT